MRPPRFLAKWVILIAFLAGCATLLPRGETFTQGQWRNYQEAQQAFDRIIPHQTSIQDLKLLHLDPESNPNITILNYSDVVRRFIPSPSINANDLDSGVQECIKAKTACIGYEINQETLTRTRYGNFWVDFLNFNRKTELVGWSFNGVILIKERVVIYKLTGGQPEIRRFEENRNPLGPLQGVGSSASSFTQ
ncbi:MAG: hypothetical protein COW48_11500 [Hydrogenophilales bacterium CG17_big_fil_post_rev_8_21_14_2_50_63_12]|nr:MAG: hypothetical protein COW48_11500 [Hydrogenophilales bacterium CG17_big_fil_post_rev_8_21_14_2_50_63_12]PIX98010.1 MAG: hypothetical protein COZ24_02290 [Hydrogenophilales bacterium CG_4_10_14_3_um_filter_63_21]PJB02643.1 MAG: hypothetical protein CO126_10890 [Hydrogenophilales bacterium CG_4_9_14_3_um_filter_63_34]